MITHSLQSKIYREKWVRDKRVEAYSNTIRYLVRVLNKRSMITSEGQTVLGKDAMREWFDEISEVRAWLTFLTIYCSERERNNVVKGAAKLNTAAASFSRGPG